jgi:hypothetical protein
VLIVGMGISGAMIAETLTAHPAYSVMEAHHALDHILGGAPRSVDGHHRGRAGAAQTHHGILPERTVVPHARTDRRLGKFEDDGSDAADEN